MFKATIFALTILINSQLWADAVPSSADKPYIFASYATTITAVVEAIDYETRKVSLRGPDGRLLELVADGEVRNFDQVKVGDSLSVGVKQSMEVEVSAAENAEPGSAHISVVGRNEEGEMPGVDVIDTTVINAVVEEINLAKNTFKLRGVDGVVKEFTARDPKNLEKASVGDLVVITYTEAVAISVESRVE